MLLQLEAATNDRKNEKTAGPDKILLEQKHQICYKNSIAYALWLNFHISIYSLI